MYAHIHTHKHSNTPIQRRRDLKIDVKATCLKSGLSVSASELHAQRDDQAVLKVMLWMAMELTLLDPRHHLKEFVPLREANCLVYVQ